MTCMSGESKRGHFLRPFRVQAGAISYLHPHGHTHPRPECLLKPAETNKASKGTGPIRSTILANDIEAAVNCVIHKQCIQLMSHYKLPWKLVATIAKLNSGRKMCMSFDGEREDIVPVACGLPQRSPLAAVLVILYASGRSHPKRASRETETSCMDDALMTQRANCPRFALWTL